MSDGNIDLSNDARALAYSTPLDQINPAQPALFQSNEMWWNFERLRKEEGGDNGGADEIDPFGDDADAGGEPELTAEDIRGLVLKVKGTTIPRHPGSGFFVISSPYADS